MALNRRNLLKLGALTGGALMAGVPAAAAPRAATAPPAFSVPLSFPPVLRPTRRTLTADRYDITIKQATAEILPGVPTPVLTYGGSFPGPTIRATAGREVVVRHTNTLTQPVVVHLHGGHSAADQDGYPMDHIMPGETKEYRYANTQPGATLWYHDHGHMTEAESVYRGLAGSYLIEDPFESVLGLPCGEHDLLLMLRDARFEADGEFGFSLIDEVASRNVILVNGRPQPFHPVRGRKYRLRLVNASNARHFALRLSTGDQLVQIASDGGLLAAPVPTDTVLLSPGERAEVVVDFSRHAPGTSVVLQNVDEQADAATDTVLRFDVGARELDLSRVPDVLATLPALPPATVDRDVVMSFDLNAGGVTLDGKTFDMDRIDQQVRFGDTEIWRIDNQDMVTPFRHNMHLHGVHFRVLERDGQPVTGHETGWKDTVAVPKGGYVRFQVRFANHTGRFLYHCHLLEHSAMGMMAQMEITG